MAKKKIGELLVESGYVTTQQVEHALSLQKKRKDRICAILMDLGYLSEQAFLEFLGSMPGIASIDLGGYEIERGIIDIIPGDMARRLEVLPIGKIGKLLTIAMVCPIDEAGREELEHTTGLKVRPVLCGRGSVLKSIERYYRQPESPEPEAIEKAEEDLSALAGTLKLGRVAKLVKEIEELPTLPDIVSAISAIVNDPKSSASDLGKVISTDGALSAKILKIANSPAFGFSRKISDINHAVALLGFRETQAIAVSISIFDLLIGKTDFDFKGYWNHSFACATLAKLISVNLKKHSADLAFVAGLLHDVGKLVLAINLRGKLEKAAALHSGAGTSPIEAEEEILGINHAEVGYLLGEHWLLPQALTSAIRYHHSPELDPDPQSLAPVVYVGNIFSKMSAADLQALDAFEPGVRNALRSLGVSEQAFRKTIELFSGVASDISVF